MKQHFIKFIGCNSEVCQFLNEYQLLNKKTTSYIYYPYIVNHFCILQPHVQYLQISCCFQILYTITSCISKHPPPLQDLISVFAEYSCVRSMKFCFTYTDMYKTLENTSRFNT
jgi:hypothetical protein